jgi:hypothetical protein
MQAVYTLNITIRTSKDKTQVPAVIFNPSFIAQIPKFAFGDRILYKDPRLNTNQKTKLRTEPRFINGRFLISEGGTICKILTSDNMVIRSRDIISDPESDYPGNHVEIEICGSPADETVKPEEMNEPEDDDREHKEPLHTPKHRDDEEVDEDDIKENTGQDKSYVSRALGFLSTRGAPRERKPPTRYGFDEYAHAISSDSPTYAEALLNPLWREAIQNEIDQYEKLFGRQRIYSRSWSPLQRNLFTYTLPFFLLSALRDRCFNGS